MKKNRKSFLCLDLGLKAVRGWFPRRGTSLDQDLAQVSLPGLGPDIKSPQ